ncbi:MAG: 16S rRNA (guanine(966)-N(2))-methyltransferase RsmD [Candidatus Eremiobacteraeota bacterium]|nr:16S rRNA (guanine(966)-N(2))-methyltransferase RsmD [Candidatus Eremiobacteraeota bacterium]
MPLRLTGGTLRSRRLPSIPKRGVRPTPARVKESLFAILGERVDDANVLDLFAGSGALGFEALSRGARHATFVESNAQLAARLRAAARELGVAERATVVAQRAERAAARLQGPFDLVFADPPYAQGFPSAALGALRERRALATEAVVVFEHSGRSAPPTPGFVSTREERYGDVALSFLRIAEERAA